MARSEKEEAVYLGYCLVLCLCGLLDSQGLSSVSPWWTRLTYSFLHANIWHLLANVYCLLYLAFKCHQSALSLAVAYVISTTVPVFSDAPVVGASGVCYALLGWDIWRAYNKKKFIIWIAAFLLVGFCLPSMAGTVHAWCCILGCLIGYLCRKK